MTAATRTAAELSARIEACEQEASEAKRALGAAELDHASPSGLAQQKRFKAAREEAERARAALAEHEQRAAEQVERDRLATASEERRETYAWVGEYLLRTAHLLEAHAALQEAEAQVLAMHRLPGGRK